MTSDATKRRLPRFSLITLLVAVNVAGVLLWANVWPGYSGLSGTTWSFPSGETATDIGYARGWPESYEYWGVVTDDNTHNVSIEQHEEDAFYGEAFVKNIVVCLAILICASLCTEFLVRLSRKAKHHDG